MSNEFRIFRLFVHLVVLRIQLTATQVALEICADADLGSECTLTCTTPDNAQYVTFLKTSNLLTALGECVPNGGGCSVADVSKYYMNQTGGVTKFIILSHSKSDAVSWRCDYNGVFKDKLLKWAQLPTNISTSTGISGNTIVNEASRILVTVGVGCLYSENPPVVEIQYLPGSDYSLMNCNKSVCSDPDLSAYDCSRTITSNSATCGNTLYKMQLKVSVSNTRNTFKPQLFSPYTIKFDCIAGSCSDLWALFVLLLLIGVIVFILLLYKKIKTIEQWDYVKIVNIAQNCCGKWIFIELRLEVVIMLVINCIMAIIAVVIVIVTGKCPVGLVIGIAIALIVSLTGIYMGIFWVVIWWVCRRKMAENRIHSETIKESPRESINGDALSPVTPGRKLPPLSPLTQTDHDKLVNTEKKKKKKKKKTKTEGNEEDQAETNKSEINDQVDAENLPETNKISD